MKIKEAHIYGFEKWIDEKVSFPQERLVCFYGENETGKSSLQSFILFILFGFKPSERKKHYPLGSSRMGGKLLLLDKRLGRFTIERLDGVRDGKALCSFSDGSSQGEEWLEDYLKGMDQSLYESIFSYSTKDLAQVDLTKGENLGDVLLTIGLTGYRNLYDIEKRIADEKGKLFKPQGSVPSLNKALGEYDDLVIKQKDMKSKLSHYKEKQNRYDELSRKSASLKRQIEETEIDREITGRKLNHFSTISELFLTEKNLEGFKEEINFPKEGIQRLSEVKDKINPLQSEMNIYKSQYEEALEAAQAIEIPDQVRIEKVKEMIKLKEDYLEYEGKLSDLQENIESLRNRIESNLVNWQLPIAYEELRHLHFPFYIEDKWRECRHTYDRLSAEGQKEKEEIKKLNSGLEEIRQAKLELEKQLLSEEKIKEKKRILENDEEMKRKEQSLEQRKVWEKHRKQKEQFQKKLGLTSFIGFILLLGTGFLLKDSLYYFFAIAFLIFGSAQYFFGKQTLQQTEQLFQVVKKGEVTQASREEIEEIKTSLERQDQLKEKLERLKAREEDLQNNVRDSKHSMERIKEREATLDEQIDEQIQSFPFLATLEVAYWPEIYQRINQLLEENEDILKYEENRKSKNLELEKIEDQLLQAYKEIFEREVPFSKTLFEDFESLKQETDRQMTFRKSKEVNAADYEKKMKDSKIKLQPLLEEREQLFRQAQVDHEDQFYEQGKIVEQKEALQNKYHQLNNQLSLIFSMEELRKLKRDKETEESLKAQYENLKTHLESLRKDHDSSRKEQSDLKAEIKQLESSEDYSEMLHHLALKEEELKRMATDWAIYQSAEAALQKAKQTYQKKYMLEIVDYMEEVFSRITDGKYNRIIPPSEKEEFTVQSNKGNKFRVEQLSQGTIEQLYISLKLSLAYVMTDKHPVPFMIDDAFVHFDEKRLNRIIDILLSLSKDKQIILFTCKKEVIEKIENKHIVILEGEDAV